MKQFFLAFSILFFTLAVSAQTKTTIKGKIVDTISKEVLPEATISLLNVQDSSVVAFALANAKGEFQLKDIDTGTFRVMVTFQGYVNNNRRIAVLGNKPIIDLGSVLMVNKASMLEEVVVEAPPITVKKDTVEFRADAFKTIPNANAEDLLKKIPGMEVDKDGNVKAQGEAIAKVYVDGKEFFGTDPKMATKNITADMIESVQVYDDMSDQAKFTRIDDGSRAKTINIKLKKNMRKGYFARAMIGVGDQGRYQGNLSLNKFNGDSRVSIVANSNNLNKSTFNFSDVVSAMGGSTGIRGGGGGGTGNFGGGGRGGGGNFGGGGNGITKASLFGINYTNKIGTKLDITGSYNYSESENRKQTTSLRQTFLPGDSTTFANEFSTAFTKNQNHRMSLRAEYYIDSMNSILYTPQITFQKSHNESLDSNYTFAQTPKFANFLSNAGSTNYMNNRDGSTISNNILYRKKFRKYGRTFTLGLQNTLTNSDGDGRNLSPLAYYNPDGTLRLRRDQNLINTQKTKSNNNSVSASYTEPIGNNKILELNYAYSNNENISDRKAFNYNSLTAAFDKVNPQQTNYFENFFTSHRYGANFRLQEAKYNFQLGGSMQSSTQKNNSIRAIYQVNGKDSVITRKQNFLNFFPTANFQYNFTKSSNLRINYRGRTQQPTITQLQDVPDVSNPLVISTGNPNLKQEFSNSINTGFNSFNPANFKYVNVNVNIGQTSNKIVNSIDSVKGSYGVLFIKPVNLSGAYNGSYNVTLGIPLKQKRGSSFNFSNGMNYSKDVSLQYGVLSNTTNFNISQSAGVNLDWERKFNIGLRARATYTTLKYSIKPTLNSSYLTQTYTTDMTVYFTKTTFMTTDFDYLINTGRAAGFNQAIPLWNAFIAQQLFKKKNGEIRFSINDILNQNQAITRTQYDNGFYDSKTTVLKRYFMLTFTYNLNKMGGNQPMQRGMPGEMRSFERGSRGGGGGQRNNDF
ncbi:MAG: TonB-dependent receptor [Chitinophagaceae bacterium]